MMKQLTAPAKQSRTRAPCAAGPQLGCPGAKKIKESLRDLFFLPSNPLRLRSHPACSASAHQTPINLFDDSHRKRLAQNRLEKFHLNFEPRHEPHRRIDMCVAGYLQGSDLPVII